MVLLASSASLGLLLLLLVLAPLAAASMESAIGADVVAVLDFSLSLVVWAIHLRSLGSDYLG